MTSKFQAKMADGRLRIAHAGVDITEECVGMSINWRNGEPMVVTLAVVVPSAELDLFAGVTKKVVGGIQSTEENSADKQA